MSKTSFWGISRLYWNSTGLDYSSLTESGMKESTGDTPSFQVCLTHVLILLNISCFTCEITMTPYYETMKRRNAINRVNKLSSIWSFFIDYSTQEIYSTCNALNNSLKSLRKEKGHCWACPAGKLLKLCCSSTAVTCPTHPRTPEGTAPAWISCWCRVLSLFTSTATGGL